MGFMDMKFFLYGHTPQEVLVLKINFLCLAVLYLAVIATF